MIAGRLGLRPSRLFPLIQQIATPCGWWVRACDGELVRGGGLWGSYRCGDE